MRIPTQSRLVRRDLIGAFSLPELLITLAIFSLLVAAMVSTQVCGLRLYRIADTKLRATADSRQVLDHVRDEIWSGKLLFIGNGDRTTFALVPDNAPHTGNALKICATTDTNSYAYYFLDTADSCLKRMSSSNSAVMVIARNVTNQFVFSAEDFQGNTVTNYQNNRVIKMTLQVHQPEYFGGLAEYYQLQTRVTRRAIE